MSKTNRSVIGEILVPSNGVRDEARRRGQKPKDHITENSRQVKALQRENRARKQETMQPKPEPFKLERFKGVP
ncbi:hypothetical protein KIPB_013751, partial [Kipferlia bialata]|eukprot:g13751.t1